jgi:hypothetical protein
VENTVAPSLEGWGRSEGKMYEKFAKFANRIGHVFGWIVKGVLVFVIVVVGVVTIWFVYKANQPMPIPAAEQTIPGVTLAQLDRDRHEQWAKIDEAEYEKWEKGYGAKKDKTLQQQVLMPVSAFIAGNYCKFIYSSFRATALFYTPAQGYATIHRDFKVYDKEEIAPAGMFPGPDEASLIDYMDATWYSFQMRYWWLDVDHNVGSCKISHPSVTMKDEIARAKAKK